MYALPTQLLAAYTYSPLNCDLVQTVTSAGNLSSNFRTPVLRVYQIDIKYV